MKSTDYETIPITKKYLSLPLFKRTKLIVMQKFPELILRIQKLLWKNVCALCLSVCIAHTLVCGQNRCC